MGCGALGLGGSLHVPDDQLPVSDVRPPEETTDKRPPSCRTAWFPAPDTAPTPVPCRYQAVVGVPCIKILADARQSVNWRMKRARPGFRLTGPSLYLLLEITRQQLFDKNAQLAFLIAKLELVKNDPRMSESEKQAAIRELEAMLDSTDSRRKASHVRSLARERNRP